MINKVVICGVNTSQLPTIKTSEMRGMIKKIQEGDNELREQFIQGNLRLVLSVIQRFNSKNEPVDDLFQIGCVGLIKAIDNFERTPIIPAWHRYLYLSSLQMGSANPLARYAHRRQSYKSKRLLLDHTLCNEHR